MDLLSSIDLPHWLMIAGAVLIAMGCLGLVISRSRQAASNLDLDPDPDRDSVQTASRPMASK
ncbi:MULTISPECIES: hypothetical protein [unclassified Bradyrhizobium]|uniref:hypothetical protein n=1 Tax=unclassified Bradyrhizobium TaxID=2631580 RepID=UPI001BA83E09|nr:MULTISPECIES: hypothetical protein [unclassified Bradyrhizobium]MBR1226357.1 hypothetical protein [Bradyrhizobium sp. AUGA SZCCT0176]MBR1236848.1 hypothetical protein [Bradyrhizobium sp. AUGA SZCCT0182]MBR1295230.1 hypothetical protein [Bradyrhizobium sp. AUGA SZCCT0042]